MSSPGGLGAHMMRASSQTANFIQGLKMATFTDCVGGQRLPVKELADDTNHSANISGRRGVQQVQWHGTQRYESIDDFKLLFKLL